MDFDRQENQISALNSKEIEKYKDETEMLKKFTQTLFERIDAQLDEVYSNAVEMAKSAF